MGGTLACGLAKRLPAKKIVVIDAIQAPAQWDNNSYDMRVSAITRASQKLFEQLGLWSLIKDQRVSPYQEMFVWDAEGSGEIRFDSADMGEPDLGHIIENRVITHAINQRMPEFSNLEVLCPEKIQNIDFADDEVSILTESNQLIKSRLLVGADGARSFVRDQAGIAIKGWDFDQAALVTTVKTELPHAHTAWQRFVKTGPLAFLPLTEGYSSIVCSTSVRGKNASGPVFTNRCQAV